MAPDRPLEVSTEAPPSRGARFSRRIGVGAVLGALVVIVGGLLNIVAFLAPINYGGFGDYAYAGVFVLTFLANASVVIPIPYVPIFLRVAETVPSVALLVFAAAVGSMLGESVAFFVGRAGKSVLAENSRIYRWMERVVHHPILSGLLLFVLSAPLNPLFDVAGLAAGALGLSYRIFATAVLLGRVVRFAVIVWIGLGIARF